MFKLKENKGFTLIELAIVLVIIGLIVGAVLKGQDLIDNAKTKKFISKVRGYEVSQWTYLDRKGGFAGDANVNGKISDGDVAGEFVAAAFTNPPYEGPTGSEINTITMGSLTFYVFFGTDRAGDLGKNIMTICANVGCTAMDASELVFIESLDVALDGSSDGTSGQFVGSDDVPNTITAAEWEAEFNADPAADAWSIATRAAVYYFDAKR